MSQYFTQQNILPREEEDNFYNVLSLRDKGCTDLLVLCGAEARAQEDRAEPDIRITRWNNMPVSGHGLNGLLRRI